MALRVLNYLSKVVMHLEDYGLSKEDLMENMKELQFTVEKDKQLIGE